MKNELLVATRGSFIKETIQMHSKCIEEESEDGKIAPIEAVMLFCSRAFLCLGNSI